MTATIVSLLVAFWLLGMPSAKFHLDSVDPGTFPWASRLVVLVWPLSALAFQVLYHAWRIRNR